MNILNKIFSSKSPKNQEAEVKKNTVTVMEMDEFYKTEIGQKVLAKPWGSYNGHCYTDMEEVDRNGYAVKRGDNYFLVSQIYTEVNPFGGLDIEKMYQVYFIGKDGKVDAWDPISFNINAHFGCKKENGNIIYSDDGNIIYSEARITTSISTGYGPEKTNNDLFYKFIAPDPHWFECITHTATRQEVLKGTAGESILEREKNLVQFYLKKREEEKEEKKERQLRIKEITDRIRSID